MMETRKIRDYGKKTLDSLVSAGKYTKKTGLIYVLAGAMALGAAGCFPKKSSDTNSGSSAPQNRAPVITTVAPITGTEAAPYTYNANATDEDGDVLTYSLESAPSGMNVISSTGVVSWTPSYTDAGDHNVTLAVTDGKATARQNWIIDVGNTNRLPSITSTPVTSTAEGANYSYIVNANDLDGDAISYSLATWPTGMTMTGNTISWTPSYTQSGNHNVRMNISDGKGSVNQDWTIAVANTNIATPTLEALVEPGFEDGVEPNYGKASTNVVFKVFGKDDDNEPITTTVTIKNQDGNETTYSMALDASNPLTSTYQTGKIFSTTRNISSGMYTIKFNASDGTFSTSTSYGNNLNIISDTTDDAMQARFGYQNVFLTGKGTSTFNADGEADRFLRFLADSNDVVAVNARKAFYDAETRAENNVLMGGASSTFSQYDGVFRFFCNLSTDGVASSITSTAPAPLNIGVPNIEMDNLTSGGGAGINFDKPNKKMRIYWKDENNNEIPITYSFNDGEMNMINTAIRTSLSGTYWVNENTYGKTQTTQEDFE